MANPIPRAELDPVRRVNAALVRDIFGNPFRPVTFLPEWRTDTIVALARRMSDARGFGAVQILADARQDAGRDCRTCSTTAGGRGHMRGGVGW